VPPEGLWWMKGGGFDASKRDEWLWTLMAVQPDLVTSKMLSEAVQEVKRKKNSLSLEKARLESLAEGLRSDIAHRPLLIRVRINRETLCLRQ